VFVRAWPIVVMFALLAPWQVSAMAQTGASPDDNLRTCLDGSYPQLCDHRRLTEAQRQVVQAAEHRGNLRVCLDGQYRALCRHEDLTPDEARAVEAAERQANLRVCLDGRYAALCRHEDLTADEARSVADAERRANLETCLDGHYAALCNHGLLSTDEAARVQAAEHVAAQAQASTSASQRSTGQGPHVHSTSCEAGHWVKSKTDDGEVVTLDDGSVWEVQAYDRPTSSLWLELTTMVACPDKLVDTDDGESVDATRIGP